MLGLVDSHCHLDVTQFDDDREAMIARALAAGVTGMIIPGIAVAELPRVLALAERYPELHCGVGIHPHEAHTWDDTVPDRLRELAKHPKVVAIGEIGIDHYYPEPPRDVQEVAFRAQIRLAKELKKPIIVHDRDAHDDVLRIMTEELDREAGGVMHCFSGSLELALACIDLGMVISFAGPLTYKSATELQAIAAALPLDKILIETDSPYLAPVPVRGKRNEPANVAHVATKLAELHGLPVDVVVEATAANARRLFRIAI